MKKEGKQNYNVDFYQIKESNYNLSDPYYNVYSFI